MIPAKMVTDRLNLFLPRGMKGSIKNNKTDMIIIEGIMGKINFLKKDSKLVSRKSIDIFIKTIAEAKRDINLKNANASIDKILNVDITPIQ